MSIEYICSQIEKYRNEIEKLAMDIWTNPEGPYKEYKACEWSAELLEKHGFKVERGAGGIKTAIKARYGSGHPIVGFLGEYDALQGLSQQVTDVPKPVEGQDFGHGCGHNLLCAASAGASIALRYQMEKDEIPGTVIFYGCPAEEILTGKPFMARAGLFDELDAAFAFHPMESNMATYGNMVAANMAKFHFKGISAHASADPYNGRSALDAVELMDIGANYLREHIKPDARVHYMITECGSVPNIVPDRASVWYFVRSKEREDVEDIYKRIVNIAKGAALMTETELEVEFMGGCYNTLNNKVLEDVVHKAMSDIRQEEWTEEECAFAAKLNGYFNSNKEQKNKIYGLPYDTEIHSGVLPMQVNGDGSSSDIGDVGHIVPTAFFTTACNNIGAPGHNWQITACSGHSIGMKGMIYGAKILAKSAFDIMTIPDILKRAKKEFAEETRGKPYKCPIPDDVKIPD